jgi:hypothetical protein
MEISVHCEDIAGVEQRRDELRTSPAAPREKGVRLSQESAFVPVTLLPVRRYTPAATGAVDWSFADSETNNRA